MKTDSYKKFPEIPLNNARLLIYKTYMQDLKDFEQLYEANDKNFAKFIEVCKSLEKAKDPQKKLKEMLAVRSPSP